MNSLDLIYKECVSGRKSMSTKKELGKTNLFFLISKDLFTWYQESSFGNLFSLSRVMQF